MRVRYRDAGGTSTPRSSASPAAWRGWASRSSPARRRSRSRRSCASASAGPVRGRGRWRRALPPGGRRRGARRRGHRARPGHGALRDLPVPAGALGRARSRSGDRGHAPAPHTDRARARSSRRSRSGSRPPGARPRTSSPPRSPRRRRPTSRSSSSAPPRPSRARASTAATSRCPAPRTSSSAASRRPTRAPSWSSTRARRSLLPWRDEVAAVLLTWFGGQEFGAALADVLLGDAEPGGRLPTTWPAREEDVPGAVDDAGRRRASVPRGAHIGYRAWARGDAAPAYPFGHGLGYTTWDLTSLHVAAPPSADAPARVSVALRNTGQRAGPHRRPGLSSRGPTRPSSGPLLWLAGFAVVEAAGGEEAHVALELPARAFAHWAGADGWRIEGGEFDAPRRPVGGGAPAARRDRRAVVFAIRTRRATSPTPSARATPTTSSPWNAGCRSSARSTASTASSG